MTPKLFRPRDQETRDEVKSNLDENLLVEAGAGTGKTTSMVARVIELLATGKGTTESVVVITFTEKAAAELSTRIREGLDQAIEEERDDARLERLREARRTLYRGRIETIHAFATSILRERPIEARLDPGFEILSGLEADLDYDARFDEWLNRLLAEEHEEVASALQIGLTIDQIRQLTETVNAARFLLPLATFKRPTETVEDFCKYALELAADVRGIQQRCENVDDKALDQMDKVLRWTDGLAARSEPLDRERWILNRWAFEGPALNVGAASSWSDPDEVKRWKELARDYREERVPGIRRAIRANALLDLLPHAERFVEEYAEERRRSGRPDFDDLLIWARDLLRENLEVRAYFQERFSALLIDEFQDTDPIQVEIAMYLTSDGQHSANWRELEPQSGKLFVVGDPKQSIYRFRRADIAIYDEVKREVLADGYREIIQNFRSLAGVIDWVNGTFEELFGEGLEGVQPKNSPIFAVPAKNPMERSPVVVLKGGDGEMNADEIRGCEARAVASLLQEAVDKEKWVVRADRTGSEHRTAAYGDVAILLPTRSGLEAYERELAAAGIPYRHEGSRDYFERQEVRDLILLLRAIDDPADAYSIVGSLRSPAFGCSDDDLIVHLAEGGNWNYLSRKEGNPKVGEAFGVMARLYKLRGRTALAELVRTAIEDSRLVEFSLTLPDGPQAAANLLAIGDQALAFAEAGGGGLRAFARWLDESVRNEAAEVDAGIAEEGDDIVRLMTMHGAKGLEFPIVVMANLASGGSNQAEAVADEERKLLHFRIGNKDNGFETPDYERFLENERDRKQAELMRVLYVGATRAKDQLVIPHITGKSVRGEYIKALADLLPSRGPHEEEVDGVWMLDAEKLGEPTEVEQKRQRPRKSEIKAEATATEQWSTELAALINEADEELKLEIDEGKRAMRPLAAESSSAGGAMILSEGPPLEIGEALHLIMERVEIPGFDDLDQVVDITAAEAGLVEHREELRELAAACTASSAVRRAAAADSFWREVPFAIADAAGYRVGRMDLVARDSGGVFLVDFKTDQNSGADHTTAAHGEQAAAYCSGLYAATGLSAESVTFVYPRSRTETELRFDMQGREET